MKNLVFFFFILIIPFCYADLSAVKDTYSQGETVQIHINIPNLFEEIKASNLIIKKDNLKLSVPVLFKKISKTEYFVYFPSTDLEPGDYIFYINEAKLLETSFLRIKSLNETFSIKENLGQALEINPGIIIYAETPNYLNIKNKNSGRVKAEITTIDPAIKLYDSEIDLLKDDDKKISFIINPTKINNPRSEILINNYSVPVFYLNYKISNEPEIYLKDGEDTLKIDKIEVEIDALSALNGIFFIENKFDQPITKVSLKLSSTITEIITLNQTDFGYLPSLSVKYFNLGINSELSAAKELYEGELILNFDNYKKIIPVKIKIINKELSSNVDQLVNEDYSPKEDSKTFIPDQEKNLKIGNLEYEDDIEEKKSDIGLGPIIIVILVIVVLLFYFTSEKKVTEKEDFKDYLRKIK